KPRMAGRPGRWWLLSMGVPVIVGVAVFVSACGKSSPKAATTVHDIPNPYSNATYNRILRATQTAAASSTQAALEAEGEQLFTSKDLAKPGKACADCHPG